MFFYYEYYWLAWLQCKSGKSFKNILLVSFYKIQYKMLPFFFLLHFCSPQYLLLLLCVRHLCHHYGVFRVPSSSRTNRETGIGKLYNFSFQKTLTNISETISWGSLVYYYKGHFIYFRKQYKFPLVSFYWCIVVKPAAFQLFSQWLLVLWKVAIHVY